jgi:hypothetical protein
MGAGVTIALPEGYRLAELERDVLLAQKNGMWAVWKIADDGELVDGHFFCRACPGAESLARADFAERQCR